MNADENGVSRRSVMKQAAAGGLGLAAGAALPTGAESGRAAAAVEQVDPRAGWFRERAYCVSGNRVPGVGGDGSLPATTHARRIYRPRSAREIAEVVTAAGPAAPIACVCGGHESSNAALIASTDAVVLDLVHLKSIEFDRDAEGPLVTVGAGVVFRELVEAVRGRQAALPVGTGPGVGVVGYVVNGGLSGYFSRRLGLLGQRVVRMTVVTAAGDLRVLTPDDPLFTAMLGAGSGLAIVADLTIRLAAESVVKAAEQRVIQYATRRQAVEFTRRALRIQRDRVLPDDSVSMELVVTGTKVLVATLVFYDSFRGDVAEFVAPLEAVAADMKLPVVDASHWSSWYETAAALWPVIAGIKGDPLAMLQHSLGTEGPPDDRILDFVCDTVVARAPLDEAEHSIVEIRTLGGAALAGRQIPSGNCRHRFFLDLITLYDAGTKTPGERGAIAELTRRVVEEARGVAGLTVDSSGTHSQPDDRESAPAPAVIFGTAAMAEAVRAQKKLVDPGNRLRFHPYAKFL
jgi:FAD/FMN-containing dehydrogenase